MSLKYCAISCLLLFSTDHFSCKFCIILLQLKQEVHYEVKL